MKEKIEQIARVAAELGAARALVQQKEEELRRLLSDFATGNKLTTPTPLCPLTGAQRLPVRREKHGEATPKLLLAMRTEMLAGNGALFDAERIAHVMDCTEQVAKIRLQKAFTRGHIDRVEPGKYTLKSPRTAPEPT